ncbi:permease [Candidatus Omnitrophus magneticus]|uniref:Probable membrane transporter protein n=1 Tax=Candidatus Omnitrophus magneticus TaxID=1609969 RepID=A0A0F0CWP4_9BACT|nr:permease [Candidatus Omnitrophus magneticus]
MTNPTLYIVLGFVSGVLSGLLGVGGAIILIPALIYLFGFSQHMAQGTTLAVMVPPIGILAAWMYYKHGAVNLNGALFICMGFIIGGLCGAGLAVNIPAEPLKKIFGILLTITGLRMIFFK